MLINRLDGFWQCKSFYMLQTHFLNVDEDAYLLMQHVISVKTSFENFLPTLWHTPPHDITAITFGLQIFQGYFDQSTEAQKKTSAAGLNPTAGAQGREVGCVHRDCVLERGVLSNSRCLWPWGS